MSDFNGPCTRRFWEHMEAMLGSLAGTVCALCHWELDVATIDALDGELEAARLAVRGNRPDSATPSWADLRLLIASDLRVLLKHLEEAP